MIAAAIRGGYAGATVSVVIGEAGVSRPTFYDYFKDRDACFSATVTEVHAHLLEQLRDGLGEADPANGLAAAAEILIDFAIAEPGRAQFLMNEAMGASPEILDARDESIAEIAEAVDARLAEARDGSPVPDLPVAVVIGGLYRWLASRLRRGERALGSHREDLLTWIRSYEQPASQVRWRTLKAGRQPGRSPFLPAVPMRAPDPLPPGRPRLTEAEVAANHRVRIMFAAAELAAERGYTGCTVRDIARRAGIDGRAFYAQFSEKQDAFMAVYEIGFQEILTVTAGAYFAGSGWPERSWQAVSAFTQFLDSNPTLTHVGFVEAYAVGRAAAQRVEDSHKAFTIFMQEGLQCTARQRGGSEPSRAAMEAIIMTIYELVYRRARSSQTPSLPRLLGAICHLWLAPFMGAEETNEFIDGKLAKPKRS
jgi:AcrR family transcriptional regulator